MKLREHICLYFVHIYLVVCLTSGQVGKYVVLYFVTPPPRAKMKNCGPLQHSSCPSPSQCYRSGRVWNRIGLSKCALRLMNYTGTLTHPKNTTVIDYLDTTAVHDRCNYSQPFIICNFLCHKLPCICICCYFPQPSGQSCVHFLALRQLRTASRFQCQPGYKFGFRLSDTSLD